MKKSIIAARLTDEERQAKAYCGGLRPASYVECYRSRHHRQKICEYYADKYQIIYGVHEETNNLHIHIVLTVQALLTGSSTAKVLGI